MPKSTQGSKPRGTTGQEQLPTGVIKGNKNDIIELIVNDKSDFFAIRYANVGSDEALHLHSTTGLDLEFYHHRIDKGAIAHIKNNHGPGKEDDPALEPVTDDDFLKILDIIAKPDRIERGKDQATGLPSIIYTKQLESTYKMVEEVRGGRKELALKTLMKHRTQNDPAGRP